MFIDLISCLDNDDILLSVIAVKQWSSCAYLWLWAQLHH